MAKATKKSEKTEKKQAPPAPKAAATSAAAPKKKAAQAKSASAAAPASAPLIDTSLAAANAARMLSAGVNLKASASGAGAGSSSRPESSMFKQLKSGLNKPHASAMNNLLDKTHGPAAQKSGQPFGAAGKQVGQNQTFGADVTRTGVPRRTSGG